MEFWHRANPVFALPTNGRESHDKVDARWSRAHGRGHCWIANRRADELEYRVSMLFWKEATMTYASYYRWASLLLVTLIGIATAANAIEAVSEDAGERGRTWKDGATAYNGICVYCHEQKLR